MGNASKLVLAPSAVYSGSTMSNSAIPPSVDAKEKRTGYVRCPALYKTEECQHWLQNGSCSYGARCQYAHGKHELRERKRGSKMAEPCKPCESENVDDKPSTVSSEQLFYLPYSQVHGNDNSASAAQETLLDAKLWTPLPKPQTQKVPASASVDEIKATVGAREYEGFLRLMGRFEAGADQTDVFKGVRQLLAYCPQLIPGVCVFEPVLIANREHSVALGASILAHLVSKLPAAPPKRQAAWNTEKCTARCKSPNSTMSL